MDKYLVIESRDPFDCNDVAQCCELVSGLVKEGKQVILFLVQNGVLAARRSDKSEALHQVALAGVQVLADDFSLRERGIKSTSLPAGVKAASLEVVLDQLAEGRKAIWL